jgi:hypothetical protein
MIFEKNMLSLKELKILLIVYIDLMILLFNIIAHINIRALWE